MRITTKIMLSNLNAARRVGHTGRYRGTTLIEVMIVVTVSALLLGLVVSLIVRLQRWDRRFRDHGVRGEQLALLAESLREDIRRATNVWLGTDRTLTMEIDGDEIRYELHPDVCHRVRHRDGKLTELGETFTIEPAGAWKLKTEDAGRREAVMLSLQRRHLEMSADNKPLLVVYGAIGADLPGSIVRETSAPEATPP